MPKLTYERPIIKKLNAGLMNKFGTSTELQPLKEIDGVAVRELLDQYGSPLFVLSERQLRRNHQNAARAFAVRYPKVQFAWSYKTNYMDAVCRTFHQEGSWAEVVSGFEYQKALRNGVPGNRIIFNGPAKSRAELQLATENSSFIHIDHFDELYTLIDLATELKKKPRVAIRVNMDTGIYPVWSRFGFNFENGEAASAIRKIVSSGKLELAGLHSHIGTYMLAPSAYAVAASKLCELAWFCKEKLSHPIQYIDLGGGFPSVNTLKGSYLPAGDTIPAVEEFAEAISTTILNYGFKQNELPLLVLETGRALVDDAGYLLGTVLAGKRLPDGRKALIADFGVNILFTSFWYDHKISPAQDFSHHTEDVVLYGPLCMNIDVIRESVSLPILNKGDALVVRNVGAYNMTQWMQFISMRPAIVLVDMDRKSHLIRKAENVETLLAQEAVPAHLTKHNLQ
jgi:diaminopimelate decarboxylase